MGLSPGRTQSSIRFSLGSANMEEQIDYVASILPNIVSKLRSLSPAGARA
jgi:cysteine desulfurase